MRMAMIESTGYRRRGHRRRRVGLLAVLMATVLSVVLGGVPAAATPVLSDPPATAATTAAEPAAGGYQPRGVTERVNVASDGTEQNTAKCAGGACGSRWAAISADGRYVAFHTDASNLVPDDTNRATDVFVHDRETGITERVSVASDGSEADEDSGGPVISADGRYVAFGSGATNLTPDVEGGLFVHDRRTGTTELVTADGRAGYMSMSDDGRYFAYQTGHHTFVVVHDRQTGTTESVVRTYDGSEPYCNSMVLPIFSSCWSTGPQISGNGRYVAFSSNISNLVPDDNNHPQWPILGDDVFVYDRETGTTERVSVTSDGREVYDEQFALKLIQNSPYTSGWLQSAISFDGRYVAWLSNSQTLVPGDTNGWPDVFVRDRVTGTTERVPAASDSTDADVVLGNTEGRKQSLEDANKDGFIEVRMSADGRYVALTSWAPTLVPGDTNRVKDVFMYDRETGVTERVSVASDGAEGNAKSTFKYSGGTTMISGDGRSVVFASLASNLVPDDTNFDWDLFVRDRGPGTGVGALEAQSTGDAVAVSGWASFWAGEQLAAAEDPAGDGALVAGGDVTEAGVRYAPDVGVVLSMRLTSLPGAGLVYRWSLTAGGVSYEVRASRPDRFAVYECAAVCTQTAQVAGEITTGEKVLVRVPLDALGVNEGDTLAGVTAAVVPETALASAPAALDEVELGDVSVPTSKVELGIAPATVSRADVSYTVPVEVSGGRFSGTLDVTSLPAGAYRVWARACLGETCGVRSVAVDIA